MYWEWRAGQFVSCCCHSHCRCYSPLSSASLIIIIIVVYGGKQYHHLSTPCSLLREIDDIAHLPLILQEFLGIGVQFALAALLRLIRHHLHVGVRVSFVLLLRHLLPHLVQVDNCPQVQLVLVLARQTLLQGEEIVAGYRDLFEFSGQDLFLTCVHKTLGGFEVLDTHPGSFPGETGRRLSFGKFPRGHLGDLRWDVCILDRSMEFQLLIILKRPKDCLSAIQELPHLPIDTLAYIYGHILQIIAVEIAIGIETLNESVYPRFPSLEKLGVGDERFDYLAALLLEDLHTSLLVIGEDLKSFLLQSLHQLIRSFLVGCLGMFAVLLVDGSEGLRTMGGLQFLGLFGRRGWFLGVSQQFLIDAFETGLV